jgi:hypothetical protein
MSKGRTSPSNRVVTDGTPQPTFASEDEYNAARIADLEAQITEVEARLANKPKPTTRKSMSRKAKAQALVEWGIVDSLKDAYAYLEDMGE